LPYIIKPLPYIIKPLPEVSKTTPVTLASQRLDIPTILQ